MKEMVEILGTVYTLEGFNKVSTHTDTHDDTHIDTDNNTHDDTDKSHKPLFVCLSPRQLRGSNFSSTSSTLTETEKSV